MVLLFCCLYTENAKDEMVNYYRITLTNAVAVTFKHTKLNMLESAFQKYPEMEEITFTYKEISLEELIANKSASDNWKSPNSG
jgi:type VI secretion system Hcp family effector